ncbi:hypothetical protein EYC80_001082 [Monilinia laxa]|uniref:Uncharacterized protein n=1 Tax=Monilinia laxa TaxID=61186 RepID=A0A5N6K817_MONLA|nr:hypothetical protein EYC80_001082 [Monilinia laxa]
MCDMTLHIFLCGCKTPSLQRCASAINDNARECPFLGNEDEIVENGPCISCYYQSQCESEEREAFAATHAAPPRQALGTRALRKQEQWNNPIDELIVRPIFSGRGRQELRTNRPGPQRRLTTEPELKTPEYDERMRRRIRDATLIMHRNISAPFDSRAPDCRPPSQIRPRKKTVGRFIGEKMKALIAKFSKDSKKRVER